MARRLIEIEPGTESWNAWMIYHRGTKTELTMALCRHEARPFYAWSEFPPERARGDRVSARKMVDVPKPLVERPVVNDGDVEQIGERLERKAERDQAEQLVDESRDKKTAREAIAFWRATEAVLIGQSPNLEGLDDIGVRYIDDPSELRRGRKPKPLRAKLVNLRDDPVGQMAKRCQIEPEQLNAARSWQALHDVAASVGGSRGIDPSAMKVDGGRFSTEPITDVQMASMRRLEQLDRMLGSEGSMLVRRILGDRLTIAQTAAALGGSFYTKRQQQRRVNRLGDRFREALDRLVTVMGVEIAGARRSIPKHERGIADVARYADNPPLYRAVREARSKTA